MNVKHIINQLKKCGWKKSAHLKFTNREHNYIFINAENSQHVVLWCVGGYVAKSEYLDFAYVR